MLIVWRYTHFDSYPPIQDFGVIGYNKSCRNRISEVVLLSENQIWSELLQVSAVSHKSWSRASRVVIERLRKINWPQTCDGDGKFAPKINVKYPYKSFPTVGNLYNDGKFTSLSVWLLENSASSIIYPYVHFSPIFSDGIFFVLYTKPTLYFALVTAT